MHTIVTKQVFYAYTFPNSEYKIYSSKCTSHLTLVQRKIHVNTNITAKSSTPVCNKLLKIHPYLSMFATDRISGIEYGWHGWFVTYVCTHTMKDEKSGFCF